MAILIQEYAAQVNLQMAWLNTVTVHHIPNRSKRATAYHEAGHAVIHLLFGGWRVREMTIVAKSEDNYQGYCDYYIEKKLSWQQEAISFLAGPIAELLTGSVYAEGTTCDWRSSMTRVKWIMEDDGRWSEDLEANDMQQSMKKVLDPLLSETQKLVQENRELIEAIATELIKYETLSENRIKELFQAHKQ
ncbi:MAG: hypothetical protein M3347_17675 [Armatimonadota bacterium]|nr:hypothetical protein [Armatimonadota bacterium]